MNILSYLGNQLLAVTTTDYFAHIPKNFDPNDTDKYSVPFVLLAGFVMIVAVSVVFCVYRKVQSEAGIEAESKSTSNLNH